MGSDSPGRHQMFHVISEQTSQGQWRPECAICKESVQLEETRADEHGQPVHQDCYVSQLNRKKTAVNSVSCESDLCRKETAPVPIPESARTTIIKFLESAKTTKLVACPDCLSPLSYRDREFFFEGQSWTIPLPFCPMCDTATGPKAN